MMPRSDYTAVKKHGDGSYTIITLSRTRAAVRALVALLRLAITGLLLYYGTLNLVYSINFQDLLMNAVAMAYVRVASAQAVPTHATCNLLPSPHHATLALECR